jgi:menaquinone-dependent protoporphyrinogen oxidase
MAVLIVYASQEGQTRKIAGRVAGLVRAAGREAVLFDAADTAAQASFSGIERVILAAPVHERRHPEVFEVFLTAQRRALAARPTLLLSVSLSAAFPEKLEEAGDYVTEMKMRTGFAPDAEALVAGAVQAGSYDYFARQVLRFVVLQGRDIDPAAGPHEFTDWAALEREVTAFLAAPEAVRG